MNFGFGFAQFASAEDVARYYNSLCASYDCPPDLPPTPALSYPLPFAFPFLPEFVVRGGAGVKEERPTDYLPGGQGVAEEGVKLQIKVQQISEQNAQKNKEDAGMVKEQPEAEDDAPIAPRGERQKNLKKNTESNLINNVFSYICSQSKSHRLVNQLVGGHPGKLKIFYIFANNFKRINGKYLNRKNIKAVCEIAPKLPHFKMLAKSIKRLLVLPVKELRVLLRKLIFAYLRGPQSLLPLLTSKKICKVAMLEHLTRRRDLARLMACMLTDYN